MNVDKVLAEIKEAVKKSMAYDELNRKFQLITNKSADEVLQRLTQTGLPSNDAQNVRGLPKLALLHELAKFYPDTPEGLGITLDAKFTDVGNVEYNPKVKIPQFVAEYIERCKRSDCGLIWAIRPDRDANANSEQVYDWLFPNGVKLSDGTFPKPFEPDNLVRPDKENQVKFARAWLDGYEVEEEPYHEGFGWLMNHYAVYLNEFESKEEAVACTVSQHVSAKGFDVKLLKAFLNEVLD